MRLSQKVPSAELGVDKVLNKLEQFSFFLLWSFDLELMKMVS